MKITISPQKREYLRGMLLASGATQAKLARRFICSRQYVNQVLNGYHDSDKANEIRKYAVQLINQKMENSNIDSNYWSQ